MLLQLKFFEIQFWQYPTPIKRRRFSMVENRIITSSPCYHDCEYYNNSKFLVGSNFAPLVLVVRRLI